MLAPMADGGGGAYMRAVAYNSESMLEFKKGIDELIVSLTESPAGTKNMAADPVSRSQFGGGGGAWIEASGIFSSYDNVLRELTKLSGLLGDCLEGMGIAVTMSKDGFEQTDDDIRRRMLAISQRTQTAKEEADKAAGRTTGTTDGSGTAQPGSETTTGDGSLG
ncbi:hypothetical protein [Streptomyces sp. NPDC048338]|uniref:hypothetical protein n=2 Tax=Streptomyces TaxID=1883 RepID=UPI003718444B